MSSLFFYTLRLKTSHGILTTDSLSLTTTWPSSPCPKVSNGPKIRTGYTRFLPSAFLEVQTTALRMTWPKSQAGGESQVQYLYKLMSFSVTLPRTKKKDIGGKLVR